MDQLRGVVLADDARELTSTPTTNRCEMGENCLAEQTREQLRDHQPFQRALERQPPRVGAVLGGRHGPKFPMRNAVGCPLVNQLSRRPKGIQQRVSQPRRERCIRDVRVFLPGAPACVRWGGNETGASARGGVAEWPLQLPGFQPPVARLPASFQSWLVVSAIGPTRDVRPSADSPLRLVGHQRAHGRSGYRELTTAGAKADRHGHPPSRWIDPRSRIACVHPLSTCCPHNLAAPPFVEDRS